MKPATVFGLREQGAMLLAVERLAELPAPPSNRRTIVFVNRDGSTTTSYLSLSNEVKP